MPTDAQDEMIPWSSREGLIFLHDLETLARALGEIELAETYRGARMTLLAQGVGGDVEA